METTRRTLGSAGGGSSADHAAAAGRKQRQRRGGDAGAETCADRGFTHAVQVDADGQHAIEDIPKLLALAERHPDALISGQPVLAMTRSPFAPVRPLDNARLGLD